MMTKTPDLSGYTLCRLASLVLAVLSLAARAAAAEYYGHYRAAAASRRSTRSHRGMSTATGPGLDLPIRAISRAGPQTC